MAGCLQAVQSSITTVVGSLQVRAMHKRHLQTSEIQLMSLVQGLVHAYIPTLTLAVWVLAYVIPTNLIPRPHPTFHRLQYGKLVEGLE